MEISSCLEPVMKTYYGEETKKALKNFPFSAPKTKMEFVFAMVKIKKAAAIANYKAGNLSRDIQNATIKVCNEILKGKYNNQFPICGLQGGAGTASNMNINEVIANRATLILKDKVKVHPNNHVNCSQSTNDVNPSALKISALYLLEDLDHKLSSLVASLQLKAKKFKNINKLGRTHMQDAVPTTLGAEFLVYADNLERHRSQIKMAESLCRTLNLGGTVIGNSINASFSYIKNVYNVLCTFSFNLEFFTCCSTYSVCCNCKCSLSIFNSLSNF